MNDVTKALPVQSKLPDAVRNAWKGIGPPVGIFTGVDEQQYHDGSGFSSTDAKTLITRSPAHYRAGKAESYERTYTKTLGSALHIGILEPWAFEARVVRGLDVTRQSKVNRERWAAFEAEHAGKEIVRHGDWPNLLATIDSVLSHPIASTLLAAGEAEQSIYFVDDTPIDAHDPTFRLCKGRTDWLDEHAHNIIVDLKSAEDASYTGFMKAAQRYTYPLQDAWYTHGVERARGGRRLNGFVFIAFEKQPPYAVGCYELPEKMRRFAQTMMARALKVYSDCLAADEWPAYPEEIRELDFPPWAYRMDIR